MEQLHHHQKKFEEKQLPITLILDNLEGDANIGGIFRLADAFNIEQIIFCKNLPSLKSSRLRKTARNTFKNIAYSFEEESISAIEKSLQAGYTVCALEITQNSLPIHAFKFNEMEKLTLVVGNEKNGISEKVLKKCANHLHIKMFGKNSSMNITHATAIALYEISKSIRF